MNFELGKFYTHRNILDSCFQVQSIASIDDEGTTLNVSWHLKKDLSPIAMADTILVLEEHYPLYSEHTVLT